MVLPIDDPKLKTLTQLRAQLIPDKRAALVQLNGGSDKVASPPAMVYRKDGQIESQVETVRDIETGVLISTKTITWTYYEKEPGAPVDTITITEKDAAGKETGWQLLKHFPDGRQPKRFTNRAEYQKYLDDK